MFLTTLFTDTHEGVMPWFFSLGYTLHHNKGWVNNDKALAKEFLFPFSSTYQTSIDENNSGADNVLLTNSEGVVSWKGEFSVSGYEGAFLTMVRANKPFD